MAEDPEDILAEIDRSIRDLKLDATRAERAAADAAATLPSGFEISEDPEGSQELLARAREDHECAQAAEPDYEAEFDDYIGHVVDEKVAQHLGPGRAPRALDGDI